MQLSHAVNNLQTYLGVAVKHVRPQAGPSPPCARNAAGFGMTTFEVRPHNAKTSKVSRLDRSQNPACSKGQRDRLEKYRPGSLLGASALWPTGCEATSGSLLFVRYLQQRSTYEKNTFCWRDAAFRRFDYFDDGCETSRGARAGGNGRSRCRAGWLAFPESDQVG